MSVVTGVTHIKIWLREGGVALERCEDPGCVVGPDGRADCGRLACPSCGAGGANLSVSHEAPQGGPVSCTCGHLWMA